MYRSEAIQCQHLMLQFNVVDSLFTIANFDLAIYWVVLDVSSLVTPLTVLSMGGGGEASLPNSSAVPQIISVKLGSITFWVQSVPESIPESRNITWNTPPDPPYRAALELCCFR